MGGCRASKRVHELHRLFDPEPAAFLSGWEGGSIQGDAGRGVQGHSGKRRGGDDRCTHAGARQWPSSAVNTWAGSPAQAPSVHPFVNLPPVHWAVLTPNWCTCCVHHPGGLIEAKPSLPLSPIHPSLVSPFTCIQHAGSLVDSRSVVIGSPHVVGHDGGGAAITDAHLEPARG